MNTLVDNANALPLDATLDLNSWVALGQRLRSSRDNVMWLVGDWAAFGERVYGEKYDAASRESGFSPKTLRNAVYVAARFDSSRRRDNLSWSHHAEVAALELEDQDRLLELAVHEGWTRARLRVEKGASERPKSATARDSRVPALILGHALARLAGRDEKKPDGPPPTFESVLSLVAQLSDDEQKKIVTTIGASLRLTEDERATEAAAAVAGASSARALLLEMAADALESAARLRRSA